MTEKEKENECCHCGDTACDIIFSDNGEELVCQDCEESEYFTCPEYGTIHLKCDGYEVEGELYSEDGYHECCVHCEWSGDEIHRDNAVLVNGDYYIREDLEYDMSSCCECGYEGHCEDFTYSDRYDGYYCEDCNPPQGNEWYRSFRKISSNFDSKPKRNEVKNWVGIEFEIENAYDGPIEDDMPEFAMAEPDGSLNCDGLEYKTHVQKGADVKNVITKFCDLIPRHGMTAGDSSIGWHFHYSLEEREDGHIRNMGKAWADFNDMVKGSKGFDYFRNMVRGYASILPSNFTKVLRDYDGKKSLSEFSQGKAYPPRGCMINTNRLLQRGSGKGNDNRRVEIRMYTPRAFLTNFTNFHPDANQGDRHELLGQDYHNFILFWDEFMRKSAVKRLVTKNNSGDLMNLRQFSRQFSPMVRNWLRSRENAKIIPHPNLRDMIEEIDDLNYLKGYDEHYGSTNSRYR